jgi:glycosyltransferase involved in cell wall biosynthesis
MQPTFSIIIPANNEENYIRKTLHSIKQQTYQDYEIIVVPNGCTDATEEIVSKRSSEKIKCVSLPNPNVSVARNTGANHATGDILVFLDADTQLSVNTLHSIKHQFNGIHSVGTTRVLPDIKKSKFTLAMAGKNMLSRTKLYKGFGGILICKRNYFNEVNGYDSSICVKEHHDLRERLEEKGEYICVDTHVTTSMRRFKRWSFTKASLFWVKQWAKHYTGQDLRKTKYEKIR